MSLLFKGLVSATEAQTEFERLAMQPAVAEPRVALQTLLRQDPKHLGVCGWPPRWGVVVWGHLGGHKGVGCFQFTDVPGLA